MHLCFWFSDLVFGFGFSLFLSQSFNRISMEARDLAARIVDAEEEEFHLRLLGSFGPQGATVQVFHGQSLFYISNLFYDHYEVQTQLFALHVCFFVFCRSIYGNIRPNAGLPYAGEFDRCE